MVLNTKDLTYKVKNKEKENSSGPMDLNTKENSKIIISTDKEYILGPMEELIKYFHYYNYYYSLY